MISASVIIPAYTMDRWDLLVASVQSVRQQTRPALELILAIDHNPTLYSRCESEWGSTEIAEDLTIRVVENRFDQRDEDQLTHAKAHGSKRRFGAGWARNTAAEIAVGDVLVFLDDDAAADADWLEHLLAPYADALTGAVGGAPLPNFEDARPAWFPANFDWVFGCAYAGLPQALAPARHLIGANLSVRRRIFEEVGGFHSIDFDDLDLCMRIAALNPPPPVLYEPKAIVRHYVPAQRVTWRYFWRRCFYVNREKVAAFDAMGESANIHAERGFVFEAISIQTPKEFRAWRRHDQAALRRLAAMSVGIAMAGVGHAIGQMEKYRAHRQLSALVSES